MKNYCFHRQARAELREAVKHWNERLPGYGGRLADAVDDTLRDEIDRRAANTDAGRSTSSPAHEVMRRLEEKFG